MTAALWLALGTLFSEDAASLAAGWLVRQGTLEAWQGVAACALGIYAGDAGLWAAGRLLRRVDAAHRWCARRAPTVAGRALALAVDEPAAIVASRFTPGTRLPLYLAAGALGTRPALFFGWSLAAVLLWTPLVVLGTSRLLVVGFVLLAAVRAWQTPWARRRWRPLAAVVRRAVRPEFWPSFMIYLPVAPVIAWLALRHGGLGTLAAANPGLPDGGFAGESKFAILSALPREWTVPTALVPAGAMATRAGVFDDALAASGWPYPLILKPDVGEKGVGVRRIGDREAAMRYLDAEPGPIIVQPHHPGPFEVGIFYARRPGQARGRIFSVTEKRFPSIVGDGESTLETLLWAHPRFSLQVPLFLRRHDGQRVLADGERLPLVAAGNHCQGCIFLDGHALVTPALEARVDAIARAVPGFFIGRFDVRYADEAALHRGEGLAIVELNGVTSESTNIYDPAFGAVRAWRTLARQWRLVFEIGAANRANGAPAPTAAHLARLTLDYWRRKPVMPIAS